MSVHTPMHASAIYDATGTRIRELPVTPDKFL
jgi:CO/xanthine dehydrogenase Mo-binding subunit